MASQLPDPQQVSLSVRLYLHLVQVYPAAFREQYGGLMVQAFRDSCLAANRQNNGTGLLALWTRTLVDVLISVIEQYGNRGIQMTKSKWIKLSGWLLVASSLLFPLGWLASSRPTYNVSNFASWPIDPFLKAAATPILVTAVLCIAAGLLGLYFRFRQRASQLGQTGIIISLLGTAAAGVGIIGLSIKDSSPWWEMIMIGITAMYIGLALFGINCLQLRLFSRWNTLPLLISLPWPLLILVQLLLSQSTGTDVVLPNALLALMFIISFGGFALIGFQLQSDVNRQQSALA